MVYWMNWLAPLLPLTIACSFDATGAPARGADVSNDSQMGIPGADGAALDASPLDAAQTPPDASPQAECTAKYGAAQSFDLCFATSTGCKFYTVTNEDTCDNLCGSFGGICFDSFDGECDDHTSSEGCTPVHYNQVCYCSL